MSFRCRCCGISRAGTPSWPDGRQICSHCRQQHSTDGRSPTQLGRAAMTLDHFAEREVYEEQADILERVLDEAQNRPPEGTSDSSIPERRWAKLKALVTAARAYNDALRRALEP